LPDATLESWERLREILAAGDARALLDALASLGPAETARAISRLEQEERSRLLTLLDPADAADVIDDISDAQAIDLIEDLPPERAAAIVDELQSDRQADLLGELDDEEARAILRAMSPEEASDARRLLAYPADSAGGLMLTEYLAYRRDLRVRDVLDDLQRNRERYADYHVQYLYVVDEGGALVGVLRMRDLIFPSVAARLDEVMIASPLRVSVTADLEELAQFFDEHSLYGVPVVDDRMRLLGIVLPEAVEEEIRNRSDRQFMESSGIVGGEELRSMPLLLRSRRRLSWLGVNVLLNLVAASVIAFYQDTLSAVIALAVFLPIISDMSGCSGNQAVAVSIRELTLGLVHPREHGRVVAKEAAVGLVNGLALGALLGGVALLWKGNVYLGLVVGGALAANTLLSVCLGGFLPLLLRRVRLDPALVSGPALTTVTDMCGFLLVLSFATALLPRLVGV